MFRRGPDIKKCNYYVEYLGWKESAGLHGKQFTERIAQEFLLRRGQNNLSKLTLAVSKKEVRITQDPEAGSKPQPIVIPAGDVAFACVGDRHYDKDVVSTIFLGFNPKTGRSVHVHVYRCDSPDTAKQLAEHLKLITEVPDNRRRLEQLENTLLERKEIRPSGLLNPLPHRVDLPIVAGDGFQPAMVRGPTSPGARHSMPPQMPDTVAEELKRKLAGGTDVSSILDPPRDYDTISRSHGNLHNRLSVLSNSNSITNENHSDVNNDQSSSTSAEHVKEPLPDYDEQEVQPRLRIGNKDPLSRSSAGVEIRRTSSINSRSSDGSSGRHSHRLSWGVPANNYRLNNSDGLNYVQQTSPQHSFNQNNMSSRHTTSIPNGNVPGSRHSSMY